MREALLQNKDKQVFKISNLLEASKNNRKSCEGDVNSHHHNLQNEKEVKVISPFYQRTNINKKCKCPFHPCKKCTKIPTLGNETTNDNFYSFHSVESSEKRFDRIKNRNKLWERSYVKNANSTNSFFQNTQNSQNTQSNQFDLKKINCKVNCRNQRFEQFLKEQPLYILTGKLPTIESLRENQIYEEFQDYILKQLRFKGDNQLKNKKRDSNYGSEKENAGWSADSGGLRKNGFKKKEKLKDSRDFLTKAKTMTQYDKIKMLIDLLTSGRKKMSFIQLKLLRDHVLKMIEESKNKSNDPFYIKKLMEELKKIDILIESNEPKTNEKENSKKTTNSKRNLTQENKDQEGQSELEKRNQRKRISLLNSRNRMKEKKSIQLGKGGKNSKKKLSGNIRKQQISSLEADRKKTIKFVKKEAKKIENAFKSDFFHQKQKQMEEFSNESGGNSEDEAMKDFRRKNQQYQLNRLQRKGIYQRNKNNIEKIELESKKGNKQMNFSGYLNEKTAIKLKILDNETKFNNKNRNGHLKGLMNSRTQPDQAQDQNLQKMRKQIHGNRDFIRKVRTKLRILNLQEFIITESDSLITQKKKIRYLSEIIPPQKSKLSSQLMKYLQIHSQHCSRILRQPIKQCVVRPPSQDCFYELPQQKLVLPEEIMNQKELNKSLKFIDLSKQEETETEQFERQKALGWITIPQFTTNTRKMSRIDKILNKITPLPNYTDLRKNEESDLSSSEESLVQIDMRDKFEVTLSTPKHDDQIQATPMNPMNKLGEQKKPRDPFQQKIKEYHKYFEIRSEDRQG